MIQEHASPAPAQPFGGPGSTRARKERTTRASSRIPTANWPVPARMLMAAYCLCFALYALLGKGFAYLGARPVFVGEVMLALGLCAALLSRRAAVLCGQPLGVILIATAIWGLVRTVPYIGEYGEDALRDAALWGYAGFALAAGTLVLRLPGLIPEAVRRYENFACWYPFLGPLLVLATDSLRYRLPMWPGTDVTIPDLKNGDLCVHLAGIACLILSGLGPRKRTWPLLPVVGGAMIAGTASRGGLVAFAIAVGLVLTLRRRLKEAAFVLGTVAAAATAFVIIDPHIGIARSQREVSVRQITQNLLSLGSDQTDSDLTGTSRWRVEWWNRILDYTVFGPYFWTGKGYGINLTVSDGIDSYTGTQLRSPHNSHLTFLARSGVPGLLLWLGLQCSWAGLMLSSRRRAERSGDRGWAAFFTWILGYWGAFIVNAAFDVSLEGPMSGIPFWIIFGLGWGGSTLFKRTTHTSSQFRRHAMPARRGPLSWAPAASPGETL